MPFVVAIVLQQTNASECKFYKVEMKQMLAQKPLDEKVQVPSSPKWVQVGLQSIG